MSCDYNVPVEYADGFKQKILIHAGSQKEAENAARIITEWNTKDVVSLGPPEKAD